MVENFASCFSFNLLLISYPFKNVETHTHRERERTERRHARASLWHMQFWGLNSEPHASNPRILPLCHFLGCYISYFSTKKVGLSFPFHFVPTFYWHIVWLYKTLHSSILFQKWFSLKKNVFTSITSMPEPPSGPFLVTTFPENSYCGGLSSGTSSWVHALPLARTWVRALDPPLQAEAS